MQGKGEKQQFNRSIYKINEIKSDKSFATPGTSFKATKPGTSNQPKRETSGYRAKKAAEKVLTSTVEVGLLNSIKKAAFEMKTPIEMKSPMDMKSAMEMNSPVEFNDGLRKASKDGKLDNNPKFKAAVDSAAKMKMSPNEMNKSPYTLYGKEASPASMMGESPLAKMGGCKKMKKYK